MRRGSTLFLKIVVYLIGIVMLGACAVLLPIGIMTDQVGYYRPILLGLYVPVVPFFWALFQALKLLGLIDKNRAFSDGSVGALRSIKYAAAVISILFAAGMPYIYYAADRDDAPGVIVIGLVIVIASVVIAAAAALFQQLFQNAVDIKSENDLTV